MRHPCRPPPAHSGRLYRDFKGSLNSSIAKSMFFISIRVISGHFYVSLARKLSPGLIPSRVIQLAVKKAIRNHEQSSPSAKIAGLKFGPICSVRDRFRSTEPLRYFDLQSHCSVSGFGLGCSVDGSVGKRLEVLQIAVNTRILFV